MFISGLEILLGLVALFYGSEFLVQGSSRVASAFGVRQIIIGLTLVAFGTSAPELVVSVLAVFQEHADISIGNIVGSNIANIALIFGIAAIIKPNEIDKRVIKFDMPLVVGVSLVFWLISLDGRLQRIDGIIFVIALIIYTVHAFKSKHSTELNPELLEHTESKTKNLLVAAGGLIILVVGGQLLVHGAVAVARFFNISDLVIGLSIVAIGTSLPELATAIYATAKDHASLSVGNIVGSNLFNILLVIGIVAILTPLNVDRQTIYWDMPVMLFFTCFLYGLMLWRQVVGRMSGLVLLLGYVVYITQLFFPQFREGVIALF